MNGIDYGDSSLMNELVIEREDFAYQKSYNLIQEPFAFKIPAIDQSINRS
ncbi:MAG: hypothetical protein HQK53_10380 [Oligoflexia bacterium]|nr:hypothetical protein [Oligoflexia bacterium]